jgi:hypothetical protein
MIRKQVARTDIKTLSVGIFYYSRTTYFLQTLWKWNTPYISGFELSPALSISKVNDLFQEDGNQPILSKTFLTLKLYQLYDGYVATVLSYIL